jgi:hypothetical protein
MSVYGRFLPDPLQLVVFTYLSCSISVQTELLRASLNTFETNETRDLTLQRKVTFKQKHLGNNFIFWNMKPFSPLEDNRRFKSAMFLRNVCFL